MFKQCARAAGCIILVQSDIEKFSRAVLAHFPTKAGEQRTSQCPCCNGLILINRHEFDDRFYAVCIKCKKTLRG